MKLINGDCLEILKTIKKKSIDLIITDVPYGVLNKSNKEAKKFNQTVDTKLLFKEYKRIIKDKGVIIVFGFGMFTAKVMKENEKLWRYNFIWKKDEKVTSFLNANERPLTNHEDIMVFFKETGATYNPQMTVGEKNYGGGTISELKNVGTEKKSSTYGKNKKIAKETTNTRYPKSVINFSVDAEAIVPTQKPVLLMEYLIKTYSNKGEMVLDPAMGSGTTGVACRRTGRHFIGIEINEETFNKAKTRIENTPVPVNKVTEMDFISK